MKLLIHSQYFPPEVGAPQNRLYELGVRLVKKGVEVEVLTAMPNYPQMEIMPGYENKSYLKEEMGGLTVHRSSIYVSKSKAITSRLRNYFSFVWSSYKIGRKHLKGDFDFVLCESPPLFLGISSYFLSKRLKAKFIFNVSDLWPESAESLGLVTNPLMLKPAYKLEAWLYKKAHLITGQTQGIVKDIQRRFPNKTVKWLPNGVDLTYFDRRQISKIDIAIPEHKFYCFYAGIHGHAQGLEVILNAAEILKEKDIAFVFLGAGPLKDELKATAKEKGLNKVYFLDPVGKDKMPGILMNASCALVPLKRLPIFQGAIPSKIFENAAMEIPLVLGVEGEAKELFIDRGNCGVFYTPESAVDMAQSIEKLYQDEQFRMESGKNGRKFVAENFDRDKIAEELITWLLNLKDKA
ncbi:glycosyltransferase family 4 protein [Luteibaculum oceani]|uniref:Glycosyltransferase family 4 protein n=1 Tax=Luteibaculum oceani TaxID=1294296 RepID=A0A5C6UWG7_9FLAO|nr:glycosyltransferase family 4 protein [Luteibaculum oceani]TXC76920.1 glycosyltransferase family 4 protein [Luteibaculum oceani]